MKHRKRWPIQQQKGRCRNERKCRKSPWKTYQTNILAICVFYGDLGSCSSRFIEVLPLEKIFGLFFTYRLRLWTNNINVWASFQGCRTRRCFAKKKKIFKVLLWVFVLQRRITGSWFTEGIKKQWIDYLFFFFIKAVSSHEWIIWERINENLRSWTL